MLVSPDHRRARATLCGVLAATALAATRPAGSDLLPYDAADRPQVAGGVPVIAPRSPAACR